MTTKQTRHTTNISNSAPFVELAQSLASRTSSILSRSGTEGTKPAIGRLIA
jgi:hypothetical protein